MYLQWHATQHNIGMPLSYGQFNQHIGAALTGRAERGRSTKKRVLVAVANKVELRVPRNKVQGYPGIVLSDELKALLPTSRQ